MKKEDKKALAEKSVEELQAEVTTLREDLLKGRLAQAVENQPLGMSARKARRQIARLLTIINQKKAEV